MTKTGDRLVAAMIAGLSAEGIKRQIKHEYRQGYPHATGSQLKMLFAAEIKAGSPPHNLSHARAILADNLLAFVPAYTSPFGQSFKRWHAFKHWVPDGEPRSL